MHKVKLLSVCAILALLSLPVSGGTILVGGIPNDGNAFPLGGGIEGYGNSRYQQAYASSQFPVGPILISAVRFHRWSGTTLGGGVFNLYMSTITAGIDTLSNSSFDANRGPDNTLFAGPVTNSGAAPTYYTIPGGPFLYNSSTGNLLLDFVFTTPAGFPPSSWYDARDNASGIFSRYHNFGTENFGWGLVTEFDYTTESAVVPEPGSLALLGFGVCALAALRRRRSA